MVRILIISLFFYSNTLVAQRIVSYTISPAGGGFVSSSILGVWNVGELTNGTKQTNKFTIHQGVVNQQIHMEITSLDEQGLSNNFLAYPNPVREELNIEWDNSQQKPFTFYFYDSEGKLLQKKTTQNNQNQIMMSYEGHNSGMYYIIIEDYKKNQLVRLKIIKNETND